MRGTLAGRNIGAVLTAVGLLTCLLGIVLAIRRRENMWPAPVAALGALFLVFAAPQTLVLSASTDQVVPAQVEVDDTLRLIGYSVNQPSGPLVSLRLYWQTIETPDQEVPVRIRLKDGQGQVRVEHTQWPRFGTGGACLWVPGEIVEDWYQLNLPSGLPAGTFAMEIARGDGPWVHAGTFELRSTTAQSAPMVVEHPLDAQFGDLIRLVGFDAGTLSPARPGGKLDVTLYWRAERPVLEDFTVFFQLLDSEGQLVAQRDNMPNNDFTPTMLWHPGQIVADRRSLQLPKTLAPGLYRLTAGLYRFRTLERLPGRTAEGPLSDDSVTLAAVKVPPAESFKPEHRMQADFGSAIRLTGFTLMAVDGTRTVSAQDAGNGLARLSAPARGNLELALGWTAQKAPGSDYTVSVQLLDSSGQLARQQDNPPVKGHYPTGLWEPGEQVADRYTLSLKSLPPGKYTLVVGLYSPESGQRLAARDSRIGSIPGDLVRIAELELTAP
jgi:hypothetical protein